jgi:hypothetical protein
MAIPPFGISLSLPPSLKRVLLSMCPLYPLFSRAFVSFLHPFQPARLTLSLFIIIILMRSNDPEADFKLTF